MVSRLDTNNCRQVLLEVSDQGCAVPPESRDNARNDAIRDSDAFSLETEFRGGGGFSDDEDDEDDQWEEYGQEFNSVYFSSVMAYKSLNMFADNRRKKLKHLVKRARDGFVWMKKGSLKFSLRPKKGKRKDWIEKRKIDI